MVQLFDISKFSKLTRSSIDKQFMKKALDYAKLALKSGDFPVGCVVANSNYENMIIASGIRTGTCSNIISEVDHAEINALKKLYHTDTSFDSSMLTIYSTLEPCLMCFGAILISGIKRIVFAYEDVMGGVTRCNLSNLPLLYSNSKIIIVPNVLRDESLTLFKNFFTTSNSGYWTDSLLSKYTLAQSG